MGSRIEVHFPKTFRVFFVTVKRVFLPLAASLSADKCEEIARVKEPPKALQSALRCLCAQLSSGPFSIVSILFGRTRGPCC